MARLSLRGLLPNRHSATHHHDDSKADEKSTSSTAKSGGEIHSASSNIIPRVHVSSKSLSCSVTKNVNESSKNVLKFDCRYTRLDSFTGAYHWLSLEYSCSVYFRGRLYPSALHAVVIAQYPQVDFEKIALFTTQKEMQNYVREKEELPEWPKLRLKIMENIIRDKFRRNEVLREKLRDTGQRELIWSNKHDAFFGQIDFRGQNYLGRILQTIRNSIIDDTELDSWLVLCHDIEADKNARPVIRLTECKEGVLERKVYELQGKPYYQLGKLPDNDIVALNPSISRRHALISIQKGGQVFLFDLNSKSKTYRNGNPLLYDHVPEILISGDFIKLGTSSRQYLVEIDNSNVLNYLQKKQRKLGREISKISVDISDPLAFSTKSQTKVFVAGLSFKTTQDDLQDFFQTCGSVKSIQIPQGLQKKDEKSDFHENQARRGIAFVEFDQAASARLALEKDGRLLKGRIIKVVLADLSKRDQLPHQEKELSNDLFLKNDSKTIRGESTLENTKKLSRHSNEICDHGNQPLSNSFRTRYRNDKSSSECSSFVSIKKGRSSRRRERRYRQDSELIPRRKKRSKRRCERERDNYCETSKF